MDESTLDLKRATTLFQMWEPHRESLIAQHSFYVRQGKRRLLSQFDDIGDEAKAAGEAWLSERSSRFDPDRDDPGSLYEDAYQEEIEFYRLLREMHDSTRLSLVAGMFHEWDKQLRSWIAKEVWHWHCGQNVKKKIWGANFDEIEKLLTSLGLLAEGSPHLKKLNACRYVVNVYKHGDGGSLDALRKRYKEYLRKPSWSDDPADVKWLDYTYLQVTDQHLDEFSDAIIGFWRAIPERIDTESPGEFPDWLEREFKKDPQ